MALWLNLKLPASHPEKLFRNRVLLALSEIGVRGAVEAS